MKGLPIKITDKNKKCIYKRDIETVSSISELVPGSTMFSKVKGFPHWPAKIVSISGKHGIELKYCGTNETGFAKHTKNLYPYSDINKNIFLGKNIKN